MPSILPNEIMQPVWPSVESAEKLAERLELLDKRITSPVENAILGAAAAKLREQSNLLSNTQRELEAVAEVVGHSSASSRPVYMTVQDRVAYAEKLKAEVNRLGVRSEINDEGTVHSYWTGFFICDFCGERARQRDMVKHKADCLLASESPQLVKENPNPSYHHHHDGSGTPTVVGTVLVGLGPESLPACKEPTFDQAWAEMERQGYRYGHDALEQVKLGWYMHVNGVGRDVPAVCKEELCPTCKGSGTYVLADPHWTGVVPKTQIHQCHACDGTGKRPVTRDLP